MRLKDFLRHSSLAVGAIFLSTVTVWLLSPLLAILPLQTGFGIAGTGVLIGFLAGRLWLTIVQWAEAADGHAGLFGGLFATMLGMCTVLASVQWSVLKDAAIPLWLGALFPFATDQRRERWKPAVKYAIIWGIAGLAGIFLLRGIAS